MTIRFLNDWNGYKAGMTRTLSAAEEVVALAARVAVDAVAAPASPVEVRFDPATSSLLGPDGKPVSPVSGAGNPGYLWINRPTPTTDLNQPGSVGNVVRFTDIGPTGVGSLWISDGTNWRTLSGRQVLSAGRTGTPGAGIVTATGIAKMPLPNGLGMVSGGSIVFPLGLLRVGTGLEVRAMMRHTGTAGTWSAPWRMGSSNTVADAGIVQNSGAAANDSSQWSFMECHFPDAASYVTGFNLIANGASGTGSLAARATNVNLAAAMYLGLYASSCTAPDTVELINYSVTFLD